MTKRCLCHTMAYVQNISICLRSHLNFIQKMLFLNSGLYFLILFFKIQIKVINLSYTRVTITNLSQLNMTKINVHVYSLAPNLSD